MSSIAIVGSGVAGTVLARRLLASEDNHQITIFEAGPGFVTGDRRVWLDHVMAGFYPYEAFHDDPHEENELFGLVGSRLFVKGGTTNHWGGETPRFKPEDFELHSRTGHGADWPITYEDLAPYYTIAETLLGVEGDSNDDDPPRYGDSYPFPPTPFTLNNMAVIDALESLDLSYAHMPEARNADRCVTTGTCDYCPVDARYSATIDLASLLGEYGHRLELRTETPVLKVLMDDKRRARGVEYLQLGTGDRAALECDLVVVCSGTIESAKLLLASDNPDWPDGIGNRTGHVGRHLVGHPQIFARGVRQGNPHKIHQELVGTVSLVCRYFDSPEYQRQGKMLFTMSDGSTTPLARYMLSKMSRSEIDAKLSSEMPIGLGGPVEQFESPENRVSLGGGTTRHGLATTKIEFGVHEINRTAQHGYQETLAEVLRAAGCDEASIETATGNPDGAHATSTCRMSASDSDGVVDPNLQVHDTENLYVCSNAVFPNVAAANPTLTGAALAVRLAEHLSES